MENKNTNVVNDTSLDNLGDEQIVLSKGQTENAEKKVATKNNSQNKTENIAGSKSKNVSSNQSEVVDLKQNKNLSTQKSKSQNEASKEKNKQTLYCVFCGEPLANDYNEKCTVCNGSLTFEGGNKNNPNYKVENIGSDNAGKLKVGESYNLYQLIVIGENIKTQKYLKAGKLSSIKSKKIVNKQQLKKQVKIILIVFISFVVLMILIPLLLFLFFS